MPEHGFLEINDYRTFPLITADSRAFVSGGELPRRGITDAGFMLGCDSGFIVGTDTVTLYSVRITPVAIIFYFRCSASGMTGWRWRFSFPIDAPFGCTAQVEATPVAGGAGNTDKGWGFLTIGSFEDLLTLSTGLYSLITPPRIEPGLIQSLNGTYVRTVSIGNSERRCPTACCDTPLPFDLLKVYILKSGITGDIRLKEGYNTQIAVVADKNLIALSAVIGSGAGETCIDYLVTGSSSLTSDDGSECESCDSYIRSINGVATQNGDLTISGSAGVKISNNPGANQLTVKVESDRLCSS